MYIFNTTFVVESVRWEAWLRWIRCEYSAQIARIEGVELTLYEVDEAPGQTPGDRTVACQLRCPDTDRLGKARLMARKLAEACECPSFSTMMKRVSV